MPFLDQISALEQDNLIKIFIYIGDRVYTISLAKGIDGLGVAQVLHNLADIIEKEQINYGTKHPGK